MKKVTKAQILVLREKGLSYSEIASELECSKSTICYHLKEGQKEKVLNRTRESRRTKILEWKLMRFKQRMRKERKRHSIKQKKFRDIISEKRYDFMKRAGNHDSTDFSIEEAIRIVEDNPVCYLTGQPIDIYDGKQYAFDHKIPVSKGGDNSLANLGLCLIKANMSKTDMTLEEYLTLCQKVLTHHGYKVTKSANLSSET